MARQENAKLEAAIVAALRRVPADEQGTAAEAASLARVAVNHLGDSAPAALRQAADLAEHWKDGGGGRADHV